VTEDEPEAGDREETEGPPSSADPAGEPEPEPDAELTERRYPSTIGGALYLLALCAAAFGIAVVWTGDWRLGIRVVAGALCFAALARLVLPAKDAGMLAVRHRLFDVFVLAGLGGLLFFLTATIPNQSV
jgi:Protein of unknown function (DUF3017)